MARHVGLQMKKKGKEERRAGRKKEKRGGNVLDSSAVSRKAWQAVRGALSHSLLSEVPLAWPASVSLPHSIIGWKQPIAIVMMDFKAWQLGHWSIPLSVVRDLRGPSSWPPHQLLGKATKNTAGKG